MSRLLGYVRVSTEEQAKGGHSLVAQRERIAAYCTAYGHALIDVHRGEGVSGSAPIETRIAPLLEKLRRREAEGLIVAKLDRLSRGLIDTMTFVETVQREGWLLVSVGDHIDTSSATGRAVLAFNATLAQLERERIGERVAEVFASKRARGEHLGGRAPHGYRVVGPCDARRLELDPLGASLVTRARSLRTQGLSLRDVAKRLEIDSPCACTYVDGKIDGRCMEDAGRELKGLECSVLHHSPSRRWTAASVSRLLASRITT